MTLDQISAAWNRMPDMTTDKSNDIDARSMTADEAANRNARNVAALKAQAECGHCGRILNLRSRAATKHVVACELENRAYVFGR